MTIDVSRKPDRPVAVFALEITEPSTLESDAVIDAGTQQGGFAAASGQATDSLAAQLRSHVMTMPIRQGEISKETSMVPRPSAKVLPFVKSRFKLLTLDEVGALEPPEWLIEDWLPVGGLGVLFGDPGIGKSLLALDWSLSVATGRAWLGRPVKAGPVVYIYAEGVTGMKRRVEAWKLKHGELPSAFRALPVSVAIPDNTERREFVKAVRATGLQPQLIVVDTLARNFGGGDENAQPDMNAFVRGCDELRETFPGATILVVHHPSKSKKKAARGSNVLAGAADTEIRLYRAGHNAVLTLSVEKQKDAEPAKELRLMLGRAQLPDGSVSRAIELAAGHTHSSEIEQVAEECETEPPRADKTDALVLGALRSLKEGARATKWEEAAKAQGVGRTTFYEARRRLLDAAKVKQDGDRYLVVADASSPGSPSSETSSHADEPDQSKVGSGS
jgi:hypothetical protein